MSDVSEIALRELNTLYGIETLLGETDKARVYRAIRRSDKNRVIVKCFLRPFRDDSSRAYFEKECSALSKLQNENILKLAGWHKETSLPFIEYEHRQGKTLDTFIAQGHSFSQHMAAYIGARVSEALACAHEAGIVHGNVKPQNIFICNDGKPMLIDFSMPRSGLLPLLKTKKGFLAGTPHFMAPEILQGRPPDASCDLYALGIVLYQLVSGVFPFRGTIREAFALKLQGRVPALGGVNPDCNAKLAAIIDGLLLRADQRKPGDARALAILLDSAIPRETEQQQRDRQARITQRLKTEKQKVRGKRWKRLAARLALCLLLAGMSVLAFQYISREHSFESGMAALRKGDQEQAMPRLEEAARAGHVKACYELAKALEQKRAGAKSAERAFSWLAMAVDAGYPPAMVLMGLWCEKGFGCDKSPERALSLYEKAAEAGNTEAVCRLGLCFLNGKGTDVDEGRAFELFRQASDKGYAYATYLLGLCYDSGRGVARDSGQALFLVRAAAERGLVQAQTTLGRWFAKGRHSRPNDREALKWYFKAAQAGDLPSQLRVAAMYQRGIGVKASASEALKWYAKAAEQGSVKAMGAIGWLYSSGTLGGKKDMKKAAQWYRKAAEKGSPEYQYKMGYLYEEGIAVEEDLDEALKWYRKAAERRNPTALYRIGLFYENGWSVEQNKDKAVEWYERAADLGNFQAQKKLDEIERAQVADSPESEAGPKADGPARASGRTDPRDHNGRIDPGRPPEDIDGPPEDIDGPPQRH